MATVIMRSGREYKVTCSQVELQLVFNTLSMTQRESLMEFETEAGPITLALGEVEAIE